tara:strand:- start:615 stop:989 length:375 start_codon:yes stop_codon:yes gene_type:complete
MAKRVFRKQDTHTAGDLFSRDDWNFAGIADAHGIESFQSRKKLDAQQIAFWNMRAQSNRQRHATVYFAQLNNVTAAKVRALITKEKWQEALQVIKTESDNVLMTHHQSWQMIPNSQLDPWAHAN